MSSIRSGAIDVRAHGSTHPGVRVQGPGTLLDVRDAAGTQVFAVDQTGISVGIPVKPWEFHVEDYGAVGDGKMILDATISASSHTLTSATAGFTSADVGKHILINNAGPAKDTYTSGALITTISAVTNSTTITLAAAASRTATTSTAMYGTDDTQAIWDTMDALVTSDNWVGGSYYCELLFDPKIYILATVPTPGGDLQSGPTHGYAQLPLPFQVDHTKTKPTIVIQGAREGDYKGLWLQSDPQPTGTVLFSMWEVTNSAIDSTYHNPSVIGGPTIRTEWSNPNASNNCQVVIDGIQIMTPVNPGCIGIDLYWMTAFRIGKVSMMPFAGVTSTPSYATISTNSNGLGFRTNSTGLNDRCDVENLSIEGFYVGATLDEHMAVHSIKVIYSKYGLFLTGEVAGGTNRSSHGCWIGYASVEITDYCVYSDTGGGGSLFSLNIDLLDNEGSVVAHIHDPDNALTGRIGIMPSSSDSLPQATIVSGGKNLEIKSMGEYRGAVADERLPAVPATDTALQNPFWRDAIVYVAGGTVSAIKVDGKTTGLTAGPILVPSGLEITITHSGAPTWTWVLM